MVPLRISCLLSEGPPGVLFVHWASPFPRRVLLGEQRPCLWPRHPHHRREYLTSQLSLRCICLDAERVPFAFFFERAQDEGDVIRPLRGHDSLEISSGAIGKRDVLESLNRGTTCTEAAWMRLGGNANRHGGLG